MKREQVQEVVDKANEDGERLKCFFAKVKDKVHGNPTLAVEEIDELLAEAEELAPE